MNTAKKKFGPDSSSYAQAMEDKELRVELKPLVLVVDDQPSICQTLADVLQDENYQTIQAHDGEMAIQMVKIERPALVFLDIWMTGTDGLDTLTKIKEISPETEVIMISGHASIANALEATRRGAFDFIEKPLDIESVTLSARRALERRGTIPEQAGEEMGQPKRVRVPRKHPVLSHPGALSQGLAGQNLGQRTLRSSVILYGQGLHSGQRSGLVLEPLPRDSGIHFGNIGGSKTVPAFVDFVESTDFATTLRSGRAVARTIEHLMAALYAYRISNLLVKCNGEVPILDGSALEFCERIEAVGIEEQGGEWYEVVINDVTAIGPARNRSSQQEEQQRAEISREEMSIIPHSGFAVCYELWYPEPVGQQYLEVEIDSVEQFKREIAPARTFGFMKDIEKLQKAGLAAGGRLDNFVLIDSERIVNTTLRFPDEQVRHKILDIMGDLFLLGRPIRGKVIARMTGHSDNIKLLAKLRDAVLRRK